jgi:hypothetical protein
VRGTKNRHRNRSVPVVTDEQRVLLAYATQHATGDEGRLFGTLQNFKRDLRAAATEAKLPSLAPHDLRRAAGQYLIDLRVPLELVSRVMGHRDTRITEQVYARVKEADLADRMLDAIDPRYATRATAARGQAVVVETLQTLPWPRSGNVLYELDGVTGTLAEWARRTGITKSTLHNRVVAKGLSLADAAALGRGGRGRVLPATDRARPKSPESAPEPCRTFAADSLETAPRMALPAPLPLTGNPSKTPRKMVGAAGFEPTTLRPPV